MYRVLHCNGELFILRSHLQKIQVRYTVRESDLKIGITKYAVSETNLLDIGCSMYRLSLALELASVNQLE